MIEKHSMLESHSRTKIQAGRPMNDAAFDLIRQAASHEGRIFVNDEDETGPALASNLITRSLIVRIDRDMTGPDKGQWYEMTAAGWDLYWKMQKSRTVGGTGRQDHSCAIK